jgi:hypothetical protein
VNQKSQNGTNLQQQSSRQIEKGVRGVVESHAVLECQLHIATEFLGRTVSARLEERNKEGRKCKCSDQVQLPTQSNSTSKFAFTVPRS